MTVVDTSALIAILAGEPEAEKMRIAMRPKDRIGTPTLFEFYLVAATRYRETGLFEARSLIERLDLEVVDFDGHLVDLAASAFMRFGRGRGHPAKLNYGDCMTYAVAKHFDAPLLFKGNDFAQTDVRVAT